MEPKSMHLTQMVTQSSFIVVNFAGYSALHYAAMFNRPEIIKLLLDGDGIDLLDRVTAVYDKYIQITRVAQF